MHKIRILIFTFALFLISVIVQSSLIANESVQPTNKEIIARLEFEIGGMLLEIPLETAQQANAIQIMLNSISNLPDKERIEKLNQIKDNLKKYKIKQGVKNEIKNENKNVEENKKQQIQKDEVVYKQGRVAVEGYNVQSFPCEPSELPKSPIFRDVFHSICVKTQNFIYPMSKAQFLEDTYLLRYFFYFKVSVPGNYCFIVNDVNTCSIYIDNELVLPYSTHWSSSIISKRSFNVNLNQGWHYIEIYHSRKDYGNYFLEIFYKEPNASEPKILSGEDLYLQYKK